MNGLDVRRERGVWGGSRRKRRASLCIDRCVFVLSALGGSQRWIQVAAAPLLGSGWDLQPDPEVEITYGGPALLPPGWVSVSELQVQSGSALEKRNTDPLS